MPDTPPDNFVFTDSVPESGNPVTESELVCVTCGTPLEYSGRGAKPKYCDKHKRSRAGTSNRSAKTSAIVTRAIDELDLVYSMAGQAVSMKYAMPGEVIHDNSRDLAESYRMLLETNAKFRKLFVDVESKAAWLPIVMVHAKIASTIFMGMKVADVTTENVNNE